MACFILEAYEMNTTSITRRQPLSMGQRHNNNLSPRVEDVDLEHQDPRWAFGLVSGQLPMLRIATTTTVAYAVIQG